MRFKNLFAYLTAVIRLDYIFQKYMFTFFKLKLPVLVANAFFKYLKISVKSLGYSLHSKK